MMKKSITKKPKIKRYKMILLLLKKQIKVKIKKNQNNQIKQYMIQLIVY